MQKPRENNWLAAKHVLQHLKGTQNYGLKYSQVTSSSLLGYSDFDYAVDLEDGKSTFGFLIYLGSAALSSISKKQSILALSST